MKAQLIAQTAEPFKSQNQIAILILFWAINGLLKRLDATDLFGTNIRGKKKYKTINCTNANDEKQENVKHVLILNLMGRTDVTFRKSVQNAE